MLRTSKLSECITIVHTQSFSSSDPLTPPCCLLKEQPTTEGAVVEVPARVAAYHGGTVAVYHSVDIYLSAVFSCVSVFWFFLLSF